MPHAPTRYQLAEFGSLLSEPARAAILLALADGSARPAGELARQAGVAPSTASAHLRKLVEGGLLAVLVQGRHRYFHVADEAVAQVLEALPLVGMTRPRQPGCRDPMHFARTCYRHLAGRLGVSLYGCLRRNGWVELGDDAVHLSAEGGHALQAAGLLPADGGAARLAGRNCLDWTERRFHLGGRLGVAIAQHLLSRDWLRPQRDSRALMLTPPGREGLRRLGVSVDA